MTKQIYFDVEELYRGKFYNVVGDISTECGKSFELIEYIARGGHSTVYSCRDKLSGEDFAIKILLNTNVYSRKRFLLENKLIQKLNSFHITKYIGHGNIRLEFSKNKNSSFRTPFIIMELAEENLSNTMRQTGPLRFDQYAGQFRGLSEALKEIHSHAIHRDIKPENVLITGERWQLSDYGLCVFNDSVNDLTPDGGNLGPKYWPSPESQNFRLGNKEKICAASDVYQLAAIFWYVATGKHPTGVLSSADWIGPVKLGEFVLRCLQHNKKNRPQDGTSFFFDLNQALLE